jgi:5-methyltetrahydropteroyltriglutamate--homocysteine methyltransferase
VTLPEDWPVATDNHAGFASTAGGNRLTIDDQRRKFELVAGTARKVWG